MLCALPPLEAVPGPVIAGLIAPEELRGVGALRGEAGLVHYHEGPGHVLGEVQKGVVGVEKKKAHRTILSRIDL